MSKFKLQHETETHEVHAHPDGHLLHIKKSLKKTDMPVQKFAEGGDVQPDAPPVIDSIMQGVGDPNNIPDNKVPQGLFATPQGSLAEDLSSPSAPANDLNKIGMTAPQTPAQAQQAAPDQAAQPAPKTQQSSAPSGMEAMQNVYANELAAMQAGYGQQIQGINAEAVAQGKIGAQQADAINASVSGPGGLNDINSSYQNHQTELNNKRNALVSDIQNGHIDPNRLWNDSSTVGKVSASIGLILGGLASGVNGGPNQALGMLNNMIDRDVAAQKTDLGKKENLLAANMHDMQNLRDATQMTKAMKMDALAHQIQMAAAKGMGPLAQAKAQQAAGALQAQSAGIVGQLAMKNSMLSAVSNGKVDPALMVRTIVDEKDRPEAYKQLQSAQTMIKSTNNLMSGYDQAHKINSLTNRVMSPVQSVKQIDGIWNPLVAQLSKDSAGRFTEADMEQLNAFKPGVADSPETARIKKAHLNSFITEKMNFPILNAYNIKVPGMPGTAATKIQESPIPLK